jgi:hypothetical protein
MYKLIAKLLYPIYRELLELHKHELEVIKWNKAMANLDDVKKYAFEEGKPWSWHTQGEAVSVDSESPKPCQQ